MSIINIDDINAMGNVTEQTDLQRSGRGLNVLKDNIPVTRNATLSVFSATRPFDSEILQSAYDANNELYSVTSQGGSYTGSSQYNNPDFGIDSLNAGGLKSSDNLNFIFPENFVRENTSDNIGIVARGPNLNVGNIGNTGTPEYPSTTPIANYNSSIGTIGNDRGYGVSVARADSYMNFNYIQRKYDILENNDPDLGKY